MNDKPQRIKKPVAPIREAAAAAAGDSLASLASREEIGERVEIEVEASTMDPATSTGLPPVGGRRRMSEGDPVPEQQPQPAGNQGQPSRARPEGYERRRFGSATQRLQAAKRPGFKRHWFNDTPDRIAQALDVGWTHVHDEKSQPIKRTVGVAAIGGALVAYLMEIPTEWYEEDMALINRRADVIDEALRGGKIAAKEGDQGYVPQGGIVIRSSTREE